MTSADQGKTLEPATGPVTDLVTRARQARTAVAQRLGVGLYAIVESLRDDGHHDIADQITHDLVDHVVRLAATNPAAFAELLRIVTDAAKTDGGT